MVVMIEDNGVTRPASAAEISQFDTLATESSQAMADFRVKSQAVKDFYDSCKNGTATLQQMRAAWVKLIELIYAREIAS